MSISRKATTSAGTGALRPGSPAARSRVAAGGGQPRARYRAGGQRASAAPSATTISPSAASPRANRSRPRATGAAALEATVEADRAAVENAKVQLQYATISSPIAGPHRRAHGPRRQPRPRQRHRAARRDQSGRADLRLVRHPRVAAGRAEAFHGAGHAAPSKPAAQRRRPAVGGHITFVDNAVDQTTGTIRIKATFPNDDRRLWPGQFVNVIVALTNDPTAVVVPTAAVQVGQQGQYAFVVKPDHSVEYRPSWSSARRRRKP